MDITKIPQYRSHKIVRALHIDSVVPNEATKGATLHFAEAGFDPLAISAEVYAKHQPRAPGVWVWYEDGYQSFSPTAAFEDGYSLLDSVEDIRKIAGEFTPLIRVPPAEAPSSGA